MWPTFSYILYILHQSDGIQENSGNIRDNWKDVILLSTVICYTNRVIWMITELQMDVILIID